MVLIVEEDTDIVTYLDTNVEEDQNNQTIVLSEHDLDMDVAHDDQEENNGFYIILCLCLFLTFKRGSFFKFNLWVQ